MLVVLGFILLDSYFLGWVTVIRYNFNFMTITSFAEMLVCEWNLSTIEMALIPSCVLFFYAIGSIISGKLADKFGRWPNLLAAYYVICVTGTASAVATSYIMFIIFRSLTGKVLITANCQKQQHFSHYFSLIYLGYYESMTNDLQIFRVWYWSKLWCISGLCTRIRSQGGPSLYWFPSQSNVGLGRHLRMFTGDRSYGTREWLEDPSFGNCCSLYFHSDHAAFLRGVSTVSCY